jgi:type IX secretion system PorP/SprF family membrane protein
MRLTIVLEQQKAAIIRLRRFSPSGSASAITFWTLAFIFCCFHHLEAQQLPLFTQYREHTGLLNPAALEPDYLGYGNNFTVGASYRSQWDQLSGAPTTMTLRGSYFADDYAGVTLMGGGYLVRDQTGPLSFTGAYGRIAGVITSDPLQGGVILGLSAGLVQFGIHTDRVVVRDQNDDVANNNQNQLFPDVGVGVYAYRYFSTGRSGSSYVYGGASMPQVLGLNLRDQNNAGKYYMERVRHIYGLLGMYLFFDNNSFIEPSVWVKYVPNAPVNVDVNLRYQLSGSLWVGTGGSTAGMLHLEAGVLLGENLGLNNSIRIGYAYDYSFRTFGPFVGGGHEINVSYSLSK